MRTRYSDRYFGTEGSPPSESSDLGATSQVVANDPAEARRVAELPRPAWRNRPVPVAVMAALLGAVAGAAGWEQWRDRDGAERSTVDVTSVAAIKTVAPGQTALAMSVYVRNNGPSPLVLTSISAVDARLTRADGDVEAIRVEPGQQASEVVTFDLRCTSATELSAPRLEEPVEAHFSTTDGGTATVRVPASVDGGSFDLYLSRLCADASEQPTFADATLESLDAEPVGTDAVAAEVVMYIGSPDSTAANLPEVFEVSAVGPAFRASRDASLDSQPLSGTRQISVRWSVNDCGLAVGADPAEMTLDVTGRVSGGETPTTTSVPPSPDLAAELTRLTQRTCG